MRYVLIADDHQVTRRGIREILNDAYADIHVEETGDGHSLLEILPCRSWDLVIVDIRMPGPHFIDLLQQIRKIDRNIPLLVLTAATEVEYAVQSMKAGANGVIQKHRATDELLIAIRLVATGGTYLHPESAIAMESVRPTSTMSNLVARLSKREIDIFKGIAAGKTIKEIAIDLGLSDKTVATYLARIREKTGLHTYVDIARYALQHGLVD